MIYTVTLNPSLDYIVTVEDFTQGCVNRTTKEILFPGGKGINVSMVLKNLGQESMALGFVAGFTGREIVRLLEEKGIASDFITLEKGISRINVKLRAREESEINGMGPEIPGEAVKELYRRLDVLGDGDTLVLAGSIPSVLPDSMYMDMMRYLQEKKIRIVVDATRELLERVLPYHPFLIKPNHHELGDLYGVKLTSQEEVLPYARKIQKAGAKNVLVSMAGDGALLVTEDGRVFQTKPPKGKVVNSVGAGDSMVAGFLAGYEESGDFEEAFYTGVCAGSASAFSENLATRTEVEELRMQLKKGRP